MFQGGGCGLKGRRLLTTEGTETTERNEREQEIENKVWERLELGKLIGGMAI
jgi:hypothetical protein